MPENKREENYQKSPDFFTTYSNSVRMTVGLWDFKFAFGEVENADANEIRVNEKLGVIMSPQHAKMFLQVFERNVKRYEEQFGEIKLPAGILVEQEPQKGIQ